MQINCRLTFLYLTYHLIIISTNYLIIISPKDKKNHQNIYVHAYAWLLSFLLSTTSILTTNISKNMISVYNQWERETTKFPFQNRKEKEQVKDIDHWEEARGGGKKWSINLEETEFCAPREPPSFIPPISAWTKQ